MTYADIQLQDIEVRRFFDFVNERHAIYLRKTRGDPWPWTSDPILQKYSFPNVFRVLDKTSIALMKQLIEPYWGHTELFFNVAIFRGYGWAPTQKAIGFIDNYEPAKYVAMVENSTQGWTADQNTCLSRPGQGAGCAGQHSTFDDRANVWHCLCTVMAEAQHHEA